LLLLIILSPAKNLAAGMMRLLFAKASRPKGGLIIAGGAGLRLAQHDSLKQVSLSN
jgi:hypothetical protein